MSHLTDTLLVAAAGVWALYFLWRRHMRSKTRGSSCGHCDGASCPSRKT